MNHNGVQMESFDSEEETEKRLEELNLKGKDIDTIEIINYFEPENGGTITAVKRTSKFNNSELRNFLPEDVISKFSIQADTLRIYCSLENYRKSIASAFIRMVESFPAPDKEHPLCTDYVAALIGHIINEFGTIDPEFKKRFCNEEFSRLYDDTMYDNDECESPQCEQETPQFSPQCGDEKPQSNSDIR